MDAVRLALIGGALWVAGVVAVAAGILPLADAFAIADRVWPILLFVVAITVVAELAATAGVFDVAADALARFARGRTLALWLLIVALAVAATSLLSLDTTAVLLTPVVITIARAHRLDVMPFAFTTVWLANTASLVLPVSNLTNLLAADRLGAGPLQFAALLGLPALIAIIVTVLLLWILHRRALRGRYPAAPRPTISDRLQLRAAAVIVVLLLPLLVSGIPPWIPATGAAVLLIALFVWRSPSVIHAALVPWQLVIFASGLFLAIAALEAAGSRAILEVIAGTGSDLPSLWQLAGVGMLGANAIDNLPAYLALESVADSPARLGALLVGVNAGSLITPWASLATLLWHQRLQALGVEVVWRRYMLIGLLAAPLVVGLSVIPLAFG
ncbi:SLC13 family permease [uncultured Microbacterium sp.]|uniref:SLC13 family permease n=1 Tax=uncultured Microbacterium sp. TaxID=191216 RepID=UPI0035CBFE3E